MIAYKFEYKDRQMPEIIPATTAHLGAIQALAGIAYSVTPEIAADWFGAEQYQSRIDHFPEGQLIALEAASGKVIGMTSSMRFYYNPERPFTEDWDHTTGYG
ncbi:MAG TPA: hypothetical protein VHD90_22210 [Phototrophicaceae bacterium]|nr:hypothetical protein [Phototrophicaceae bacterium]